MGIPVYSFATLREAKDFLAIAGTGKEAQLELAIAQASRMLEAFLGRRVVYRAPAEVDGGANIVASVALANGGLTIAAQPNVAGRTLVVTVTDADRTVTAGTLTATGTVAGVAGVTEVFDLTTGAPQHGRRFFESLTSLVVAGVAGATAADLVKVGSSEGYVEFHSAPSGAATLSLLEWPVMRLRSVHEDTSRLYGSTTQLVEGTDFAVTKDRAILTRQDFPSLSAWSSGWRAVRGIYSGGYCGQAGVPEDLKGACLRLAGLLFEETQKGRLGVSSQADAVGNWTRFGPASLTPELRDAVGAHKRWTSPATGERDFDLEAA